MTDPRPPPLGGPAGRTGRGRPSIQVSPHSHHGPGDFCAIKGNHRGKLPEGVQDAVVEVVLTFRQLPGVPEAEFPIHKVTREVSLKR